MSFDLLQDFWLSLDSLEISGVAVEALASQRRGIIDETVRRPMHGLLREAAGEPVATYTPEWLQRQARADIRYGEFCVTLDHKVYFAMADYELDVTRAASDYAKTGSQNFVRRPRKQGDTLERQIRSLRRELDRSGTPGIVLADDGLATGGTIDLVVAACRSQRIRVDRIVVCCNNNVLDFVRGIAVEAIVPRTPHRPWLNERDLYWGLPRSGLSLAPPLSQQHVYGIPFTFNTKLVGQRIGIEDGIAEFRVAALEINQVLWSLFEDVAGTELYCEDCPPLRFVPDILGYKRERVTTFLDRLVGGDDVPVRTPD